MNGKVVAVILGVLVVLGAGAFALTRSNPAGTQTAITIQPTPEQTANETQSGAVGAETPAATNGATVTYTETGFSPETVRLKAGTTLTVTNDSNRALQFDSDPHPQHTANPELNLEIIESGATKTVVVKKTGSHGIHNHVSARDTGTVIVE
ncbi:MAG TPA: cupredoxin domain-containing protein [Candidatus Limnocylindrales bacterium]|nr:cupredoxin domain-containing protein [Candidatus Limnocylindrales bacterium]